MSYKSPYASKAVQKRLIKAVNLLCEHADGKLPVGYEIRLVITRGCASLELSDPNGDDIDVITDQASTFDEACVTAIDDHAEQLKLVEEEEAGESQGGDK